MPTEILPQVPPEVGVNGQSKLGHDSWMSEFQALQWSDMKRNRCAAQGIPMSSRSGRSVRSVIVGGYPASVSDVDTGDPSKTMDSLRAEIKLLHWHKLANEAAIKAALLRTKKIKAHGGATTRPIAATTNLAMPTGERALWMQQIIEEEQSKPLHVTKHFMKEYEEREKGNEDKLETEVAAHIRSLRNLRGQIEQKAEMKARVARYRATYQDLAVEKQQLLLGKIPKVNDGRVATSERQENTSDAGSQKRSPRLQRQKTVGAMDTVLGSLNKLVELEKRISSLERSNMYDQVRASKYVDVESLAGDPSTRTRRTLGNSRNQGAAQRRGRGRPIVGGRTHRLSFSKQKLEATADTPSQICYSVHVRREAAETTESSSRRTERKARVGRKLDTGVEANERSTRDTSTFLTQLPDIHRQVTRPDGRSGDRSNKKVGFRSAIMEKRRLETKRKIARERAEALRISRQNRIISEWLQHKKAATGPGARHCSSSVRSKPLASCAKDQQKINRKVSIANSHLQEFRQIRAHYARRTERLRRDLATNRQTGSERPVFVTGTRTTVVSRPNPAPPVSLLLRRSLKPSRSRLDSMAQRVNSTSINERCRRPQRTLQRVDYASGGRNLGAGRAQQQQSSRFRADDGKKSVRKQSQCAPLLLPTVQGTGFHRAVGGCTKGRPGRR